MRPSCLCLHAGRWLCSSPRTLAATLRLAPPPKGAQAARVRGLASGWRSAAAVALEWVFFLFVHPALGRCLVASRLGFAGSRSLGPECLPLVREVVRSCVASSSGPFSVGCSSGGDALALLSLLASGVAPSVRVFAVGSSAGEGFWSGSALSRVRSAASGGARVRWLAGGPLSRTLRARLAARSSAFVRSLAPGASLCLFLASPSSPGSLRSARLALAAGCRVFAFACGFSPALLPSLGPGRWVRCGGGPFVGGFRWLPG